MLHQVGRVKPEQLVPIGGLEVVFVDGGINVTLTRQEVQGVVHINLGHLHSELVEDGVPVEPGLVHGLPNHAIDLVVVLVVKGLSCGAGDSCPLDAESSTHHRVGEGADRSSDLSVDFLLELSELEVGVYDLQHVSIVLLLGWDG